MTAERLEACGYQKPVEAAIEVVATETASDDMTVDKFGVTATIRRSDRRQDR